MESTTRLTGEIQEHDARDLWQVTTLQEAVRALLPELPNEEEAMVRARHGRQRERLRQHLVLQHASRPDGGAELAALRAELAEEGRRG